MEWIGDRWSASQGGAGLLCLLIWMTWNRGDEEGQHGWICLDGERLEEGPKRRGKQDVNRGGGVNRLLV